ncbi:C39 family peptidase [Lactobacillus helveticus]|uniref:C39 family peptidase n=1 Tax=Lactobacillus helveticus TaxID=1587 RepID=UPI0021822682|nr:C39 family peptidase [Lactobacillus helveticus]
MSQLPEMPTGCEITAVTMMINFAGVKVTKQQAAKVMHYSSNPNKGFVDSTYKKWPGGYWVAPNGIKSVVKHYLGTSQVMTGASMTSIKKKLLRSHCVVMWVGMFDGISNHAITLTGYHNGLIYFMDPWTGTKRSIKESTLKVHWALDAHRALSY